MIKRIRFNQHPWGPMEGFVKNYLTKNFWRVEGYLEHQDVMQDAFMIYSDCLRRYASKEDMNRKWMMALFIRSFTNHFTGLTNRRTKQTDNIQSTQPTEEGEEEIIGILRYDSNEGYIHKLVEDATDEVGAVLRTLLYAPSELLDAAASSWSLSGKRKAQGNAHIIELMGLDLDPKYVNILDEVERYLVGDMED